MRLTRSPRARRRLLFAGPVVLLLAGVAAVFALIPSHGPSAPGPTGKEGPAQVASAEKQTRLTAADRRGIDRTLDRFLPAAMERRDPAAGWALAGPEMKSGSTLADWRRGDSPVPYYAASETTFHDWQLIDSGPGYVIFNLLVHPAKTSKLAPYVFSGEVVKQRDRWLVNRLYTIAIMNRVTKTTHEVGPADFAAGAAAGSQAPPDKTDHPSRIAPVLAILAAIALLPLTLAAVALRRSRRWRRQVRSSGRSEIPTLPARYRD
jgi:hypothetical protein